MCTGKAREAIKHLSIVTPPSLGMKQAMETLHYRFGQKHIVVKAHLDSITDGPPVKLDKNSLDTFVTDSTNCQIVMEAWNFASELNSSQTLNVVFKRLPVPLQRKFVERVDLDADEHFAKFNQLVKFVKESAMRTNSFVGQVLADAEPNKEQKKGSKAFSVQTMPAALATKPTLVCPDCSDNHQLWRCERFKSKPVQQRWIFVKKQKLCFNCLGSKHTRNICRCSRNCKNCNKPHHTLLHTDEMTVSENRVTRNHCDGASQTVVSAKAVTLKTDAGVRLMVAPVRVFTNDGSRFVDTYCFLDNGSQVNICSQRLMNKLHAKGANVKQKIIGIAGSREINYSLVSLRVKGLKESATFSLPEVLDMKDLPDISSSIPRDSQLRSYKHLHGLHFPEVSESCIDLLIGAGAVQVHSVVDARVGSRRGQPTAFRTSVGWVPMGPDELMPSNKACYLCLSCCEPGRLNDEMQQLFEQDFCEKSANIEVPLSVEDKLFLSKVSGSVTKLNGHYQIALPWRQEYVTLPNNRVVAERCLVYLKRKFERDAEFFDRYKEKINELLRNGFARKVPSD